MPELRAKPTDAELISAWRTGDESAAAELVRRHARAVARYLSAAGGGEDVDDLVQEAFYRAFRKLDGFRGTASFRTWVMTIGSNALKDLRRREARRTVFALEEREVVDESANPHASAVVRDLESRLQREVERLPEKQRQVFLMRAQQGIDYEEIADVLGTSVGAARVHYHQAVKRLKKALG
jgi:RNA polymerase sigma-70 factor (ECF subfamily)